VRLAISLGEQAARAAAPQLRPYAVSESAYAQHLARRTERQSGTPVINFVRVDNQSRLGDAVIGERITLRPGEPLDVPRLQQDIAQIYGLGVFETVGYDVLEENGQTGLVVKAKEKSWGPGYLQLGMTTSNNFKGDSTFRIGVLYTLTELNALNGEWRVGLQAGQDPGIFTEIYQPLDSTARYFINGKIGYGSRLVNVFDNAGHPVSQYRASGLEAELGAGREFGTWGEARLGYRFGRGTTEVNIGIPAPTTDFRTGQLFARLADDTMDNFAFPRTGHAGLAEWRYSRQALGASSDYDQYSLSYSQAFSWGSNTLNAALTMNGTWEGNAPFQALYRAGGLGRLSGLAPDQLSGQYFGMGRLGYRRRIKDIQFFSAYLGGTLELGNVWQQASDISFDNTLLAGSLYLGMDTPIGPVYLGYGHASNSESSVYLFLGPLFSF
jgi:NTE family protein